METIWRTMYGAFGQLSVTLRIQSLLRLFYITNSKPSSKKPAKTTVWALLTSPLGTFCQEGHQRLSDKNSILMMKNLSKFWSGALIGRRSSLLFQLLFANDRQTTYGRLDVNESTTKQSIFAGIRSSLEKAFAGACSLKEQKPLHLP